MQIDNYGIVQRAKPHLSLNKKFKVNHGYAYGYVSSIKNDGEQKYAPLI